MNGAECLIRTAQTAGIEICFANPGTTEMPLVAALDAVPGVRAVLGLFEGVCTGAADGYARMTGRPALTLLHLGPGFANGIANLHNARRARSGVINLIGDQATWHLAADAPLTSDIASLARPVGWVREVKSAGEVASAMSEAINVAQGPPGRVASLVLPADAQWDEGQGLVPVPVMTPRREPDEARIAEMAAASKRGRTILLLGGDALTVGGLRAAHRLAAARSWSVFVETFSARIERGQGIPDFPRLPYFPEQAVEALAGADQIILADALSPVAFFGYQDGQSALEPKDCAVLPLIDAGGDAAMALEALADVLGAPPAPAVAPVEMPATAAGPLNADVLGRTLAACQPLGTILVDEAATTGFGYAPHAAAAPAHTQLGLTGGAIGQGIPCATGAALACPDRPVISFQADGSGLYTFQGLWTQAREGLNVTTLICANRAYRILQVELARSGVPEPGPQAQSMTDLSHPTIDWTAAAKTFGVPGERVETGEELKAALDRALVEEGPHLIEAVI